MVKVERKNKKKKEKYFSTGAKAALGILGGMAAASGIINKTPAGIVKIVEQEKTEGRAGGAGGEKTIAEAARETLGVPEANAAYERLQLYQTILPSGTIKLDDSVTELAKLKSDPTYGGGNTYARTPNGIVNLLNGQIVMPASELNYQNITPADKTNITAVLASVGAPAPQQLNVSPVAQTAAPAGSVSAVKTNEAAAAPAPVAGSTTKTIAGRQNAITGGTVYTVLKGDSLWKISKARYGSGAKWRQIYDANRDKIQDPKVIYAGQELIIP